METEDSLKQAIQLRKDGKYKEAESIMIRLHDDNPQDALINYHFAWLCDVQGKEKEAVPYYETAISGDLSGKDLRGALLGLGSTYRTLGEYEKSVATLKRGMATFPEAKEFPVFLSMALYNTGKSKESVSMLLKLLLEVTDDNDIQRFKKAIALYAEDLNKIWED